MNWDNFWNAFQEAKTTMRQADSAVNRMAEMLDGRLGFVDVDLLAKLKRQLRDFNMQTKEWMDK